MAGESMETNAPEIRAHADHIDRQLHPGVVQVMEASRISLGIGVLGVLGQAWAGIFRDELDRAQDAIAKLPSLLETDVRCLRDIAGAYESTEDTNAAMLDGADR